MNATSIAIGVSLFTLTVMLAVLCVRGIRRYLQTRMRVQLMWGAGLAFAAAAMGVEGVVYVGFVNVPLLQAYVFLSAAIVGVLSLGATRVLRSPKIESGYTWYTVAASALVGVVSFVTPLSPSGMVTNGIITGDPPLLLLVLSTLVTAPATVVLITASVVSLRRDRRWQTLLMIAGAVILGAGGTLYIASFPVALYYAEFLGIVLLFLGLISIPQSTSVPAPRAASKSST